jgi:phosphatidate cytidylyltransferase
MALNLKVFTTRFLTAIVFVAVLLTGICVNYNTFTSLFFIVSIWGLYEFYQLSEKLGAKPYKLIGILSGFGMFTFSVIQNNTILALLPLSKLFAFILVLVFLVFVIALFDSSKNTILNITYTITGLIYTVVPFMLLVNISCTGGSYNYHYILGIILLIWASDVGAYLVGSFIGKHKLYERISPGKTWEGTLGATLITIGCAVIISFWYTELALVHWIVISLLVCVFGTIGDLVESMFKRHAGVKDSGKIMPGHGGILDRFDSLLFVSPFIYAYLTIIN